MHFSTYRSYNDAYALLEEGLIDAAQRANGKAKNKMSTHHPLQVTAQSKVERAESWADITLLTSVEAALDDIGGLVGNFVEHHRPSRHH